MAGPLRTCTGFLRRTDQNDVTKFSSIARDLPTLASFGCDLPTRAMRIMVIV